MDRKLNLKILNIKKRRKKYIDLFLDIAPESKHSMGKKRTVIQKVIIEQMKQRHFTKIKSDLAIEIIVYSSEKNPPRIERFVKNLLDLMHKKETLGNVSDTDYLPFEEDRRIKYLSVRYIFLPGKAQVIAHIRPFRSFISDLHFISNEDIDNDEDSTSRDDFQSIRERYEDLIESKEKYLSIFSKDAYESMLDLATWDMQKSLTANMKISPFLIRLIYPSKGIKPAVIKAAYKEWATMLMDFPIRIKLPEIPTQKNTSKTYKSDIKKQLSSYADERPIFKNLKAPAIATVFYSPPVRNKRFYKDVDNIMLEYILPCFNDVFSPPLSLMNLHLKRSKEFSAIPKSLNGSAMGYEILELPKKYSTEKKGFINMGFKVVNLERDGIIESMDRKIDTYIKECEYLND